MNIATNKTIHSSALEAPSSSTPTLSPALATTPTNVSRSSFPDGPGVTSLLVLLASTVDATSRAGSASAALDDATTLSPDELSAATR